MYISSCTSTRIVNLCSVLYISSNTVQEVYSSQHQQAVSNSMHKAQGQHTAMQSNISCSGVDARHCCDTQRQSTTYSQFLRYMNTSETTNTLYILYSQGKAVQSDPKNLRTDPQQWPVRAACSRDWNRPDGSLLAAVLAALRLPWAALEQNRFQFSSCVIAAPPSSGRCSVGDSFLVASLQNSWTWLDELCWPNNLYHKCAETLKHSSIPISVLFVTVWHLMPFLLQITNPPM